MTVSRKALWSSLAGLILSCMFIAMAVAGPEEKPVDDDFIFDQTQTSSFETKGMLCKGYGTKDMFQ